MPDFELLRTLAPPVEPAPPHVVRRARRGKRPKRRRPVLLTAPVAAALLLALFFVQDRQTPFAAAAIKAAEASPRLLIEGWTVTRVDEWDGTQGEMTFERDGRTIEVSWPPTAAEKLERVRADLYRYPGADDYVARVGTAQLRGSRASVTTALPAVRRVSAEEWLKALPDSAVQPRAQAGAIDDMLKGVPLPPGFTPPQADGTTRDRYQLGAKVVGAVVCTWIARHLDGDPAAAKALDTARGWPILREMAKQGAYHEVVFQYADALNGRGNVPAGKLGLTVERTYKDAFGC